MIFILAHIYEGTYVHTGYIQRVHTGYMSLGQRERIKTIPAKFKLTQWHKQIFSGLDHLIKVNLICRRRELKTINLLKARISTVLVSEQA